MTDSKDPVFFTSHGAICEIRFNQPEKLNALCHLLGATSGRSVSKAAIPSSARARSALATQCIGGRMGIAMILEAA
jgi:acetyl-CoA acyltransferase